MKNNPEFGESVQMAQQPEIGFQLPPPYSVENTGNIYNANNSNQTDVQILYPHWPPINSSGSSGAFLNLFNQSLGNNERFTFSPMGRVGFMTRTIIVQIRDNAQRPLLSVMTLPGRNVSTGGGNDNNIRIGSVIQMTNTTGQILLNATENGQVCKRSMIRVLRNLVSNIR